MSRETFKNIESAIDNHVRFMSEDPYIFSTGWVIVTTVPSDEGDRYITITSDGLQYHALIGLLDLAKADAVAYSAANIMKQTFEEYYEEDED